MRLAKKTGFNFQWMYSYQPGVMPREADEKALDFMAKHGFNFARVPTDYHFWTADFDYRLPNEAVFEYFDRYLEACRLRGIHMSLNLHRAPGYCINGWDRERDNLWKDEVAADGFAFLWETFAKRYKGVSNDDLSFDLVNEPPNIGERGFTRDDHQRVIRRTVAAIRAIDPEREIVIDGLAGGHLAMPELADLGVIHSGRGYQPMPVSHYEASWWSGSKGLPQPEYPGTKWDGLVWDRNVLHDFYDPWRAVEAKGVKLHMGEFGCFNHTPNDVALRWFRDLFSVWNEFGWGYAMWGFEGAFGIIDHGRPGARLEEIDGYRVDRDLFELMKSGLA
ncbi:MAG TPA: cellulase family glycosylhydrolase [Fimbriimonadaceae bacterium]|nr:cellulase family glycosylhydrolase [Fimbriimonadaceae bacterium]